MVFSGRSWSETISSDVGSRLTEVERTEAPQVDWKSFGKMTPCSALPAPVENSCLFCLSNDVVGSGSTDESKGYNPDVLGLSAVTPEVDKGPVLATGTSPPLFSGDTSLRWTDMAPTWWRGSPAQHLQRGVARLWQVEAPRFSLRSQFF